MQLYTYKAEVTGVYDGDSVTIDIDLGLGTWRRGEKLRLYGVDTPEVRGESREAGLIARDFLRALVLGKPVIIRTHKDQEGKYGRLLAEIFLADGTNVNELLVERGLARRYT